MEDKSILWSLSVAFRRYDVEEEQERDKYGQILCWEGAYLIKLEVDFDNPLEVKDEPSFVVMHKQGGVVHLIRIYLLFLKKSNVYYIVFARKLDCQI